MLEFVLGLARVIGAVVSLWASVRLARRLAQIGHRLVNLSRSLRWRRPRRGQRRYSGSIRIWPPGARGTRKRSWHRRW